MPLTKGATIPVIPPAPPEPTRIMCPARPPRPAIHGQVPVPGKAAKAAAMSRLVTGSRMSFSHRRLMP